MMRELLTDWYIMGAGAFVLGAIVMAVVITVTSTRHWHNKHHQNRSELMCNLCTKRWIDLGSAAPPRRILGDPRR